jgi:SAM-dependent methyltransferase
MVRRPSPQASGFDGRADDFDRRSAPPHAVADEIARAVDAASRDAVGARSGGVLDLGAGTGVLGLPLAQLSIRRGVPYVGLDLSLGMLDRFRSRRPPDDGGYNCGDDCGVWLVRADASRTWPLLSASMGSVFAARAAHLLDSNVFVREVRRVTVPGGILLLGAVRRDPDAPRAVLRRRLHQFLAEHGIEPRSARHRHRDLSETFGSNTTEAAPTVVASWTVTESLDETLAAWRRPGHLAGREVSDTLRCEVLDRLHAWALDRWAAQRYDAGHDPRAIPSHLPTPELQTIERFELTSIRLPP